MQIFFYKYGAKWSHAIKTLFYPRKMPKQESLHIIFIYVFECFFIEKESVKVYFERKSSDSFLFHSSFDFSDQGCHKNKKSKTFESWVWWIQNDK